MSLGVSDPKLTNPKLSDQPELWSVLPPASRNGDKKNHAIYQNNQQTSTRKEVEPAEPVPMTIYQSNTYRKDFS